MTVSVVMAVHNGERFLAAAVESILAQSNADFEFLIIDDGSTDNTHSILASYRDPRIRVIRGSNNRGLAAALNTGLELARGTFIARMDADDIAEPRRLSMQLDAFRRNPDAVLVGSACIFIDDRDRPCGQQEVVTDNDSLQVGLLERNQFCHPSTMIRTAAIRSLGGYRDVAGRFAQDYDLWLRLAELGQVMNLAEPLIRYRIHPAQASVENAFGQRRAAEFYKLLARHRRAGQEEDLEAANEALGVRTAELRALCAADLLHMSSLLRRQRRRRDAGIIALKAVLTAPFSRPVRDFLRKTLSLRSNDRGADRE